MLRKKRKGRAILALLIIVAMIAGIFSPHTLEKTVQAAQEEKQERIEALETENEETEFQESKSSATEEEIEEINAEEKRESTNAEEKIKSTDVEEKIEETNKEEIKEEQTDKEVSEVGSISGKIWLDENSNGIYESEENPVCGYTVSLYEASDKEQVIATAATKEDGKYLFPELTLGDYVVGIPQAQTVEEVEYLAPVMGVKQENKFIRDDSASVLYTETINVVQEEESTDYNAGVALPTKGESRTVAIKPETGKIVYGINHTILGFAGREWYIIGDSASGVISSGSKEITLLSKDDEIGKVKFSYTDNHYSGSTLQTTINNYAETLTTDVREAAMITARRELDGIGGPSAIDQKLWPLSLEEYNTIKKSGGNWPKVLQYPAEYWLRTPGGDATSVYTATRSLTQSSKRFDDTEITSRPAFYLNVPNVLFVSSGNLDEGNMKTATPGNPTLDSVEDEFAVVSGSRKMTVQDDTNLSLTTTTTEIMANHGDTVSFDYSGAKTGAGRSISVMICERDEVDNTEKILYYGRPVDMSTGNTSGKASFTIPKDVLVLETGADYILKVFNEEVNGINQTDYASEPQEITLKIRKVMVSSSSSFQKVYDDEKQRITIIVNNPYEGTIKDVRWYRFPRSAVQAEREKDFEEGYEGAEDSEKGVFSSSDWAWGSNHKKATFYLYSDKNAEYRIQSRTIKANGDVTSTLSNPAGTWYNYTSTPVSVRGEIAGSSPTKYLYNYEKLGGKYGIPYDIDGTTVLPLEQLFPHVYDKVSLIGKDQYSYNWSSLMKSNSPLPLDLTIDSKFLDPLINREHDGSIDKYTISYTKIPSTWRTIDVSFVDTKGQPIEVGGVSAATFDAPMDRDGSRNISKFLSSGGFYIPPSDSEYEPIGYGVGDTFVSGNVIGDTTNPVDFENEFDPVIPANVTQVYVVYPAITTTLSIEKSVTGVYGNPNQEFEITIELQDSNGDPVSGRYSYTGSAIQGVTAPTDGTIVFTAGKGKLFLKHGQTITIRGVKGGYTYTVKETDQAVSSGLYTPKYSGTGELTGSKDGIFETLGDNFAKVKIINERSSTGIPGGVGTGQMVSRISLIGLFIATVGISIFFEYRKRKAS